MRESISGAVGVDSVMEVSLEIANGNWQIAVSNWQLAKPGLVDRVLFCAIFYTHSWL
jgi:hypothetical protein